MAGELEQLFWAGFGFRFAHNLREIRKLRGMSQIALAEISGISRSQLLNLERNENNSGTSADPVLSTVYKLAHALEVPPELLLPESESAQSSRLPALKYCGAENWTVEYARDSEPLICEKSDIRAFSAHYIELKRCIATGITV
ncbi:MAG: helix-turn-helix transcriptional regulator [Corynebacterium sp.]|nr:helix-turn-helix transcriptional regulator [Corynebacterium sp.]